MMTRTRISKQMMTKIESSMLDDKPNDISSNIVAERDPETNKLTPIPPLVNPRYWHNKLDDAQQMGFIDGFNAANDPSRVPLAVLVGIVIGFLAGFFTFYR